MLVMSSAGYILVASLVTRSGQGLALGPIVSRNDNNLDLPQESLHGNHVPLRTTKRITLRCQCDALVGFPGLQLHIHVGAAVSLVL